jgi:hypothetical protein
VRFLHHPGGTLSVSHDPHWCGPCKTGDHEQCGPARCFHNDARVTCACNHEEDK